MAVTGINWLASYPKSGNTWIRAFLAAYILGEKFDINQLEVVGNSDSNDLYWRPLVTKSLADTNAVECMLYRPASLINLLQTWAGTGHDFDPIVKTHVANIEVAGVKAFPAPVSNKAVYVVRDPRDVLVSVSRYFGVGYDKALQVMQDDSFVLGTDSPKQPITSWGGHVRSWGSAELPVLSLKYEDILENPYKQFRLLLDFLGWEVHETQLTQAVELSSFDNLRDQEKEKGIEEAHQAKGYFFQNGRWGVYKNKLTKNQINAVTSAFGETMEALDYL